MIETKSIENSLFIEDTDIMNEYDAKNFENNLTFYKEGVEKMLSVVLNTDGSIHTTMVAQTMDNLKDVAGEYKELEEFFEDIINARRLNDLPLATKVCDLSLIEKIRPQYLSQIVTDIGLVIDRYLKRNISKGEIDSTYLSENYLVNLKKQMVKTRIPYQLNPKELTRFDAGTIIEINTEFISSTMLPFLRNVPQFVKELEVTSANVISVISKSYDEINTYALVVDKLLKDEKISIGDYRFLNKYLYAIIRTFMKAASYLSFIMIKKISLVSSNIASYKGLQLKILNYFPEGERVLHENVITGSTTDIDMPAMVLQAQADDASIFRAVLQTIVNKARSNVAYAIGEISGIDSHSIIDMQMDEIPYQDVAYRNGIAIFNTINDGLDIIRVNAKDPIIPFDDIISKSGLGESINSRFTSIISKISDLSEYESIISTNIGEDDKKTVFFMALHELSDASEWMDKVVNSLHNAWMNYKALEAEMIQGDNLVYKNPETVKELQLFLREMDAEFSQLMLTVLKAFMSRIEGLSSLVRDLDSELFVNPDVNQLYDESPEDVDFFEYAKDSFEEINAEVNAILFESYLKKYHAERTFYETGMRVVYEDGLATSAGQTNTGNQNQTTTTSSTKATASTGGSIKDKIKKIIESVKNFFTKSTQQIQDIISKQSGNLKWLEENKDRLINRNFQSITVNVLPYEKYVSTEMVTNDLTTLRNNITALTPESLKKYNTKQKLNAYLFSFMEGGVANKDEIGDTVKTYYKVKSAKLEVMPYKGAAAKALTETMVDYCIGFYSGFSDSVIRGLNEIQKALTAKLESLENINESVLYEAEGDTQPQQANATSEQKPNTQPKVQTDKKVDSSVKDGKKVVQEGSTYNIMKWLSLSVQTYSAGVLTAVRDRNYDYLKVIKGITPKDVKPENTETEQNTEQQPAQAENQ